jgi:hypothetical protein
VKISEWDKVKMDKYVFCDHESDTRITLSPWTVEYDFICKKCRCKKIKSAPIGTVMTDTRRGFYPDFKPYKPPREKKGHWWQKAK